MFADSGRCGIEPDKFRPKFRGIDPIQPALRFEVHAVMVPQWAAARLRYRYTTPSRAPSPTSSCSGCGTRAALSRAGPAPTGAEGQRVALVAHGAPQAHVATSENAVPGAEPLVRVVCGELEERARNASSTMEENARRRPATDPKPSPLCSNVSSYRPAWQSPRSAPSAVAPTKRGP